jgi:hypothetical protein
MSTCRRMVIAGLPLLVGPFLARPAAAQQRRTALDLIDATRGVSTFAEIIRTHTKSPRS